MIQPTKRNKNVYLKTLVPLENSITYKNTLERMNFVVILL